MNIDQLTIAEAKEIARMLPASAGSSHPFTLGVPYFIRTVTHHLTGRLVAVYAQELVLEDAAWIADDGRFANAVSKADFAEVEPFPDGPVIVGRASIIDAVRIGVTPRSQK